MAEHSRVGDHPVTGNGDTPAETSKPSRTSRERASAATRWLIGACAALTAVVIVLVTVIHFGSS
jgi:hypothetical protein